MAGTEIKEWGEEAHSLILRLIRRRWTKPVAEIVESLSTDLRVCDREGCIGVVIYIGDSLNNSHLYRCVFCGKFFVEASYNKLKVYCREEDKE